MVTLVYKMTHTGDPDFDLGLWGVNDKDCMGKVRDFGFDAVIGIGGCSWWPNEPNRAGEIVWIGLGPLKTPVKGKRGPEVRFAHFRPFRRGELMLSKKAPKLDKAMQTRRFRLYLRHHDRSKRQAAPRLLFPIPATADGRADHPS